MIRLYVCNLKADGPKLPRQTLLAAQIKDKLSANWLPNKSVALSGWVFSPGQFPH